MPSAHTADSHLPGPGERPIYLLCEDGALAEQIALDLRHYGMRARTFVNAEVLRNVALANRPAAILVEVNARSALEARDLDRALEQKHGARTPMVAIGASDDLTCRLHAVAAGAAAFLPAPISLPALLHTLHRVSDTDDRGAVTALLVDLPDSPLAGLPEELARCGVQVERLTHPEQVLEWLDSTPADALLVNGHIEQPAAMDLVRALRQSYAHAALPAIILTAEDKRQLDDAAAGAGVDAIVGLPVAAGDLAAIVRARAQRAEGLAAAYRFLSRHDPASGLLNRGYFIEALRHALEEVVHGRSSSPALLYVHVGRQGDAPRRHDPLLVQIADRIRRSLPTSALCAQTEADGVAALLYHCEAGELERLADRLAERLKEVETATGSATQRATCRVGVTLLGKHHRSWSDALARARQAADLQGADEANAETRADADAADVDYWRERVAAALDRNAFRLVYQPIANLSGQPTAYYEVFVRMLDDSGADVLPREFLPALEGSSLAGRLDRWVTGRAIHVLESQQTLRHKPVLFVKLFASTVTDVRFVPWLRDELGRSGVAPERLVFQITEQTATTRLAETAAIVEGLKAMGCSIVIEHFGAGATIHQDLIKQLAPRFVKLSPALTRDIGDNREHQKRVQAITGHNRAAGARTIAALIQDAVHLAVLWQCGVEFIQGYFMQEPSDVFAPDEPAEHG